MKRDSRLFIEDILENIRLIESSTKNISKIEFESDRLIADATIRRLEIIGEAVKNIPEAIKKKYPDIPWRDIAGLRDIIAHAYFGVAVDRIWEILEMELPDLKEKILKIKEELENR